jgi:hypothetical protein
MYKDLGAPDAADDATPSRHWAPKANRRYLFWRLPSAVWLELS